MEWINVEDRLPNNDEKVLIYDDTCEEINVAIFRHGKTKAELAQMKKLVITSADEDGNNKKPYAWYGVQSPMWWFGQRVTHWMPLPKPPEEV